MLKKEYNSVKSPRVEVPSLEDWLREELGEEFIEPKDLYDLWYLIDDGCYDENGKLIGVKDNTED